MHIYCMLCLSAEWCVSEGLNIAVQSNIKKKQKQKKNTTPSLITEKSQIQPGSSLSTSVVMFFI